MKYPLAEVLEVKIKRVERAEEVVKEKREALEKEEEKLRQCEEERDKAVNHLKDKYQQLNDEIDGGTTSPKIQQMKAYIKVVHERVETEKKKVAEQKEQVAQAKQQLENALEDLRKKRIEVDKIEMHKESWIKEMKKELEIKEGHELDEIGSVIYSIRQRKEKSL